MAERERDFFIDNLLVRIHLIIAMILVNHRDNFSGPALRHETLNSLVQVALYIPSSKCGTPKTVKARF